MGNNKGFDTVRLELLFIIHIYDSPIASDLFNVITYADDATLTSTLQVFNRHCELNNNINE